MYCSDSDIISLLYHKYFNDDYFMMYILMITNDATNIDHGIAMIMSE